MASSEENTAGQQTAQHLLTEPPMMVYPSLALALGINKAIIFQELHFLLNGVKTTKSKYNFVDGRWWVYNSYLEWRSDFFIWLSIPALKKLLRSLEKDGLVLSRQGVRNKSDRRKWYTIDYAAWAEFCRTMGQKVSHQPRDIFYPIMGQIVSDGSLDKNYPTMGQKVSDGPAIDSSNDSATGSAKAELQAAPDGGRITPPNLDPILLIVAKRSFDLDEVRGNGGRIGVISRWLHGGRGKLSAKYGQITAATPAEVTAFYDGYTGAIRLQSEDTIALRFMQFRAARANLPHRDADGSLIDDAHNRALREAEHRRLDEMGIRY